jgi:putative colanic acid biosynthesis acetyltransferase WcaF
VKHGLEVKSQKSQFDSPWSRAEILRVCIWKIAWAVLCRWTPKYAMDWRVIVLRLFGCRVSGRPFVSESARIRAPWRLTLMDRSCLGPYSEVYNLGEVVLHGRATVAQHAYLCGGSHDFSHRDLPLVTGPITMERDSFVGAKAIVLLGVIVGEGAVIGAGAVITKAVPPWTIWAGNPALQVGIRNRSDGTK